MHKYILPARSRADLRYMANQMRSLYGDGNQLYFPIVKLLDVFTVVYESIGFNYEILDDAEFEARFAEEIGPGAHAVTLVRTKTIYIKESIYNGACNGNGRDRMTIAHELGHFLTICLTNCKLIVRDENCKIPKYRDPEWQAKCFAGELLIPVSRIKGLSINEIVEKCGVSPDAAEFQARFADNCNVRNCGMGRLF